MSASLFSSTEYVLYRFEYPETLFQSLRAPLSPALRDSQIRVLDLGCGTGLVTESFLKSYSAGGCFDLVDPDKEMLEQAKKHFANHLQVQSFQAASAEALPFDDQSFDLILVGSAWHWMKQEFAVGEIERVLKPQGLIYIFEYQFPKAIENSKLNDWIRLQFNSTWKAPSQTPRGSLKELTHCFRNHPQFSQGDSCLVAQEREHHASELAGVIISQSRYQHFEQSFPIIEKGTLRTQLESNLDSFLMGGSAKFSYSYEGFLFKKRV